MYGRSTKRKGMSVLVYFYNVFDSPIILKPGVAEPYISGLNQWAEQLGGGWPSHRQIGAWLKRRAVLHVARRDVFVSVMTLLDEQTIRTENVQYLSDSSILNHRR